MKKNIIFLFILGVFYGAASPALAERIQNSQPITSIFPEATLSSQIYNVNDVVVPTDEKNTLTGTHSFYQRYYDGVEVLGGDVVVHEDTQGSLSMSGDYSPIVLTSTEQEISKEEAFTIANTKVLEYFQASAVSDITASDTIAQTDDGDVLAWNVHITGMSANELPLDANIIVDKQSGDVLLWYSNIYEANAVSSGHRYYDQSGSAVNFNTDLDSGTYTLEDTLRNSQIYTANNLTDTVSVDAITHTSSNWDSLDRATAVELAYNIETIYDYFSNIYGRDSYDDAGGALRVIVDYGDAYANAFASADTIAFGDGNGTSFDFMGALDISAHEWAHLFTEQTANLAYQYESGALNESVSDMFGTAVEQWANDEGRRSSADWMIGDDIAVGESVAALRNMCDPNSLNDPTHYSEYYDTTNDFGGVHTNSSISNNMFCLLSEGGTNSVSGESVTGIGIDKAALIIYTAMNDGYVSSTDGFIEFREATEEAADALIVSSALTSADKTKLQAAWDAVGVSDEQGITVTSDSDFEAVGSTILAGPNQTSTIELQITSVNGYSGEVSVSGFGGDSEITDVITGDAGTIAADGTLDLEISITPTSATDLNEYEWTYIVSFGSNNYTYVGIPIAVTDDSYATAINQLYGSPGDTMVLTGVNLDTISDVEVNDVSSVNVQASSKTSLEFDLTDDQSDGYVDIIYEQDGALTEKQAMNELKYYQFDHRRTVPQILTVGASGKEYTTITDAVNNSENGDTILVYDGTYDENIAVTKNISIIGKRNKPTILGSISSTAEEFNIENIIIESDYVYGALLCTDGSVTLQRSVIQNSVASLGSLIYVNNCNLELSGNKILNNTSESSLLQDIYSDSGEGSLLMVSNWIDGNSTAYSDDIKMSLLRFFVANRYSVLNNVFYGNTLYDSVIDVTDRNDLEVTASNNSFIQNTILDDSTYDMATLSFGVPNYDGFAVNSIYNSIFDDNVNSILCSAATCISESNVHATSTEEPSYTLSGSDTRIAESNNTTSDPLFADIANRDLTLGTGSPALATGYDVSFISDMPTVEGSYDRGAMISYTADFDEDGDGYTENEGDTDDADNLEYPGWETDPGEEFDDPSDPVSDPDDNSDDEVVNDPDVGTGDGSDDSASTLGKVDSISAKRNQEVVVQYSGGSSKRFKMFSSGTGKAKVRLNIKKNVLVAINQKQIRAFDAYTGARLDKLTLHKREQYKVKIYSYNIYKKTSQNNILVLSQQKKSNKKRLKLRAFTLSKSGNLKKKNIQTISLNKSINNFARYSLIKSDKNGSKARIILKHGSRKTKNKYRITKSGNIR